MDRDLTTVHDALQEAAIDLPIGEKPMETYTFRAHKNHIARAKDICQAHGTSLSEYLRKCVELLPRDYRP